MVPTQSPAFTAALMATARIAGIAAVVACAPKSPAPPATAGESAPAEPVPSASDVAEAASDEPAAPTSVASPEDWKTCQAMTSEALGEVPYNAVWDESLRPKNVSPAVVTCCELMLAAYGDSNAPEPVEARWGCCAVVGEAASIACSPWGPPSPPAFA